MGAPRAAQEARLLALELRRGELLKNKEDLDREIAEIERDCRILAEALDPEPAEETPAPGPSGEKVN